jgi:sec-independent protein translocase protein TatB
MPSFPDTAVIVLLALLLFGPKKLPVLARQLGKLMADFRRASNEFRTQMEEELRISEQADRQKQIAAIEAAAPKTPAVDAEPEPEHPHLPPATTFSTPQTTPQPSEGYEERPLIDAPTEHLYPPTYEDQLAASPAAAAPLPIAVSGDLSILPPATGLPVPTTAEAATAATVPAHQTELETETLHG